MLQHDLEAYRARWSGFGWHAVPVEGHDIAALLAAFEQAVQTKERPTVLLARTLKGKGISFVEDKPDWHGKAFKKGEEADKALAELNGRLTPSARRPQIRPPDANGKAPAPARAIAPPDYKPADSVATREAFGSALVKLGEANPRVVVLDADVKNSTFTDKFAKQFPDRFFEDFIAEQNMIGTAVGLASRGKIPFAATFACFLTRAYDFIRMAAISQSNVKLMGSHVGVSIGEDGPSQMGLEDLAMMAAQPSVVVLYPADAVCTHWLTGLAAEHTGMVYIRTGRPKNPILYRNDERFTIGGSKVLRQSGEDRLTVVAAGVTVFEALKAYEELARQGVKIRVVDLYSLVPVDRATLLEAARATRDTVLTVEDHYAHGGLGDTVLGALASEGIRVHKLAVTEIPHSGKPDQLLDRYGISAAHIIRKARSLIA